MRKVILVFFSVVVLLGINSCSVDDGVNFHFVPLETVEVVFPESFTVGQTYTIDVTYIRPNNCTYFEGFDFTQTGMTDRSVVLVGSEFDDRPCEEVTEQFVVPFHFEVLYDEPYHFKFWAGTDNEGNDIYLEYDVPIAP